MKRRRRSFVLLAVVLISSLFMGEQLTNAQQKQQVVDIVFTSDIHSHLNSFNTYYDGKYQVLGGLSRMKTVINEKKKENPDTLVVDAGDFSMGTLIQAIYAQEAPELRMLGALGVEATVFGNHEFDYLSKGLASMLGVAKNSKDNIPSIVICNIDWDSMDKEGLTQGQKLLKDSFSNYGIKDYIIVDKGGVRIAIIGVFGKDSIACSPTCELKFKDPVKAVSDTVKAIKQNEQVDLIMCLSHSGISDNPKNSEDEILAKKVPELDLIVSGHAHKCLSEPIRHGDTYIVASGEYGIGLGLLQMTRNEKGRWTVNDYSLKIIDESIEKDREIENRLENYNAKIDSEYLNEFGYTHDTVIANNDIEFSTVNEIYQVHMEHNLGNILSDAFKYAAQNASDNNEMITMAIVGSGSIRDSFDRGNITVEDIFRTYSLGIGPDEKAGYPLLKLYLYGKEIKLAAEVDATVSDFMNTARVYESGMCMKYNPNRILLNKVVDCYITDENGERQEIEDDKLYSVVVDLYCAQMLGSVESVSFGLISISPKHADGTVVENFEDCIIYDNGKELKAWDAIARYMSSFEDTGGDGIPDVPEYYRTTHDRKVVDDSKSPGALLSNLNVYAIAIMSIVMILIILIVLIIIMIVKRTGKRSVKE